MTLKKKKTKTFNKFLWIDFFSKKNDTNVLIEKTLKRCILFERLSNKEILYLSKVVHVRSYEPGEAIFTQYEKGLGMYLIAKGEVEIKTRLSYSPQSEGLITTLSVGSFFGELALIDSENIRTASAYALGPATMIGFFKPDLMEILERKPEIGVKVLYAINKVLSRRLTETTEMISSIPKEYWEKKAA